VIDSSNAPDGGQALRHSLWTNFLSPGEPGSAHPFVSATLPSVYNFDSDICLGQKRHPTAFQRK
jgi:hypothetical protein